MTPPAAEAPDAPPSPSRRAGAVAAAAFHPAVTAWFVGRFSEATPAQSAAWPAIAAGKNVLVTAPTGSGKTLAAFLACLDRLVRRAADGTLEDRTYVVYVSPLKALSNDVKRNLEEPLAGIAAAARDLHLAAAGVRTAVRTGDTSMADRRAAAKRPPHVLVTTPESLYILMTSDSGRRGLRGVETVIVDEIHAVLPDKRGAHLALTLERLAALAGPRLQRIGLSATVRPLETAARLLVGARAEPPLVVDASRPRALDVLIDVPQDELGAVCTHEQWAEIYDRVASLAREHRSTLVFVNTRRLVERVARALGERLGADVVAAHHGSLSREKRFAAEQRLKAGELRLVVATASLELGIDVGAVELVCLLGSPRSVAVGLQRIGRAGHAVGGTPKGRLFPLTRDQLVECAALVRAARAGELERVALRDAPLDILAQQIVAACAAEEWDEDALFELVRRAAPYVELTRASFDALVAMLSEGIATSRGRSGALLHRDGVNRKLRARRGARMVALTSGGAIPDTAQYDVVLEPEGTIIGSVDEDFAVESMAGDIMQLGNASWRIRRIEAGRLRVEDAAGQPPTIPFWLGEGPARSRELSGAVADLRAEVATRLERDGRDAAGTWLVEICALAPAAAALLVDYVATGLAQLGALPTRERIVVERFFDEAGGTQIVVHAPFGGRINRAFGMALRKRFCRSFDFELQAAATDEGILLSLGPQHSLPLEAILELVSPDGLDEVLTQAALQAPMFETRWRWNATRSLALPRHRGGKKIPPILQKMRAQDLLAAVFPAQVACQDNHGGGPIEVPEHPLAQETVRDCLTEAMDAAGLRTLLEDLRAGRIARHERESAEPSVFAHEILNSNPYTFLDDAPLEERRSRLVSVRRGLPAETVERLGGLDAKTLRAVAEEARPAPRTADELHDLLLDLGVLPEAMGHERAWGELFVELVAARRAARLSILGGGAFWVAAERRSLAALAYPGWAFVPDVVEPPGGRAPACADREAALTEIVQSHMAIAGPVTAAALAARLALPIDDTGAALAAAAARGAVMRGRFTQATDEEWCDRRLLARANRRMTSALRREIEPVPPADFLRFLTSWQHVAPGTQLSGRDGLLEIVGMLQGFEAAAGAWERELLGARLRDPDPQALDDACLRGDLVWGRLAARPSAGGAPSRATPIALLRRRDQPWLLASRDGVPDDGLSSRARAVLDFLRGAGASFSEDIAAGVRALRAEIEDALWELVAAGRITADGFSALRALLPAAGRRGGARSRWYAHGSRRPARGGAGRWALLDPRAVATDEERIEAIARQLLRRYGVVMRDLLAREDAAPPWRDLLRAYRVLEMRGELRGGRFVAGLVGEQFALPEAVEALRAIRRREKTGQIVRVSACDPLNLIGILTPGPRIPATLAHHVAYRDGVPVAPPAAASA